MMRWAGAFVLLLWIVAPAHADPLAAWNEGPAKQAILDFVSDVTREDSPDFVPPAERIAVFDNDGTLWSEQPLYVQLAFALDRVRALSASHPEWQQQEPFKSVLAGDLEGVKATGVKGIVELVAASHANTTTEEFDGIVRAWLETARHPVYRRPYTELVYQPMLELLDYLRANGFKTYIVSGGGVAFMRPWTEGVYRIPPEQVIGSRIKMRFEAGKSQPVILRLPEIDFIDDKEGKPVAIEAIIGRRPIAAFGNSDGDFQMLEGTTAGKGRRFAFFVHHDDGERESAYDRHSSVGKLDRGLNEAAERGWLIVSMKNDWAQIFPPAQ